MNAKSSIKTLDYVYKFENLKWIDLITKNVYILRRIYVLNLMKWIEDIIII